MKCRLVPAVLAVFAALAGAAHAGEVQVAVAANFAAPLAQIGAAFTKATGHTLKVSSGATGKLYHQITVGAPFDVLIAADDKTPARLLSEGLAVPGTNFTYAIGKLVLWSARPGLVDDKGAVLDSANYTHIAIANPKVAPYGQAGIDVLKARGLTDRLAGRIVTAETIAQAFHFVSSGNAEIGFVALSQLLVPGKPAGGSYWLVPSSLYVEIRQDAVLLKTGQENPAAAALLAYLKGEAAKATIQVYGYGHAAVQK